MNEVIQVLIPAVAGAGAGAMAAYVAIKADLAEQRARVINVEKAVDRLHERMDNLGCVAGSGRSRH